MSSKGHECFDDKLRIGGYGWLQGKLQRQEAAQGCSPHPTPTPMEYGGKTLP